MDTTYSSRRLAARVARPGEGSPVGPASDADLIARSIRDPDAFTALFERHWEDLYRFCLNRTGGSGEDIAAEAFRVAFDRRRRYDQSYRDARPWLFGIATNLVRDHFRAAAREEEKLERSAALERGAESEGGIGSLERGLLGPELAAALAGIPPGDRDALLLMAWADLSYEQIAEALGTPIGTVRSRISRARRRVREHLAAGNEHRNQKEASA
jgi:RNA polymerase sigma factor (sigma-70 family)